MKDRGGSPALVWSAARALLAGYLATLVMEQVTSFLYARQDEAARKREEELRQSMPTALLADKAAQLVHTKIEPPTAQSLGSLLHYGLGAAGGLGALLLRRRGWRGVPAGLAVGVGMTVSVDEGLNYVLGLTAPPGAWPWQARARGLVGHLAYGMVLGALMDGRRG